MGEQIQLPSSLAPETRDLKLPQWAQVKLATLRIALLERLRSEGPHPESGGDLQTVLEWLEALPALDMDDIVADGGVTCAMVVQQEARGMAGRLKRAMIAASPPPPKGEALPVVITAEMVERAARAACTFNGVNPDRAPLFECEQGWALKAGEMRAALMAALQSQDPTPPHIEGEP